MANCAGLAVRDPSSGARVYLADRMKSRGFAGPSSHALWVCVWLGQGLLPDAERAEPHLLRRIEKAGAHEGRSVSNLKRDSDTCKYCSVSSVTAEGGG